VIAKGILFWQEKSKGKSGRGRGKVGTREEVEAAGRGWGRPKRIRDEKGRGGYIFSNR